MVSSLSVYRCIVGAFFFFSFLFLFVYRYIYRFPLLFLGVERGIVCASSSGDQELNCMLLVTHCVLHSSFS